MTLLLVNIFSGFFQQPSNYLPRSFLGSSSAHSFCCIGAMSSSQSLFFGFVPLSTSLSVLERRFPARNPLGSVLKVIADRNHCKHNSCSCTRTHGCIFRVQETGAASLAVLQEACNNICCQPKRIAAALYTFMPRHCCFFFVPPFCFFVLQPLFAFGLCSGDTGIKSFGLQPAQLHSAYS